MIFGSHLDRGLGLPASPFFRQFLIEYGVLPHHLPPNTISILSALVSFSEAYLGLLPTVELFATFFYLAPQKIPKPGVLLKDKKLTQLGAAMATPQKEVSFPTVKGLQSCKGWTRTWFYIKNARKGTEFINLPHFAMGTPAFLNDHWTHVPDESSELRLVKQVLQRLVDEGLAGDDLFATFVMRRVSPLQLRTHKMCHMSGKFDPTRHTTYDLTKVEVQKRIRTIIGATKLPLKWQWGKEPFSRSKPVTVVCPQVSHLCFDNSGLPPSKLSNASPCFYFLQKFNHHQTENTNLRFPPDRTKLDERDPDPVRLTKAEQQASLGKYYIFESLRTSPNDDDDDDCRILEVIVAQPLAYAYSAP